MGEGVDIVSKTGKWKQGSEWMLHLRQAVAVVRPTFCLHQCLSLCKTPRREAGDV